MIQSTTVLWHLAAGMIVLVLPGLAGRLWLKKRGNDFLEILADCIGLSISFTALIALIAYIIGWHFSGVDLIAVYLVAGILTLAKLRNPSQNARKYIGFIFPLAIFSILVIWRFYQASELVLPAWVDSLHHVLIVRVFLENGGIPNTLEPYIAAPFYYHFAFHSITSVFAFLSGFGSEKAVMWLGQVLNAAVALSVYRLGLALWDDWRRAGLAALLVGFVSTMPAYYVSWGRYTLLVGLILLPLAMAVALDIFKKGGSVSRFLHLAILTGGLLLAHYFAAGLFAIFLVILGVQAIIQDMHQGSLLKFNRWLYLTGGGFGGVVLAGVWILRMWGYAKEGISFSAISSTEVAESLYFPDYLAYLWQLLGPEHNYVLMALAGLGLLIALWQTNTRAFGLWSLAIIFLSLPWGLQLNPFRPDHAVIIIFLPAVLLSSTFLISARDRLLSGRLAVIGNFIVIAIIGLTLTWGINSTRTIINPATVLASEGDMQALRWIDDHIPEDAVFFINVVYWQNRSYRGVDGGWWITPLTGRATLLPPAIHITGDIQAVEKVLANARKASQLDGCTAEFWELFEDANLTHLYLNRKVGPLFPESIANCPELEIIYEKEGISIYEAHRHKSALGQ